MDINATDENGSTALFSAAFYNQLNMIRLLIKAGIQIDHRDVLGHTALSACLYSTHDKESILNTVRLLLQQGAQEGLNDVLCWAARKSETTLVKHLLEERGIDINTTDRFGVTALFGAARAGNFDMMQLLIDKGIDVDYKSTYNYSGVAMDTQDNYKPSAHTALYRYLTELSGARIPSENWLLLIFSTS